VTSSRTWLFPSGGGGGGGGATVSSIIVTVGTPAANYDSVAQIPAGCRVERVTRDVRTGYDGAGAQIEVRTVSGTILQAASACAAVAATFTPQVTDVGAASAVRVVRSGAAGTVGAAVVIVEFSIPAV
jgi:hypothetical protein